MKKKSGHNKMTPIGSRYLLRMVLEVKLLPENGLWDQRHPYLRIQDGPGPLGKQFIEGSNPPWELWIPIELATIQKLCLFIKTSQKADILHSWKIQV